MQVREVKCLECTASTRTLFQRPLNAQVKKKIDNNYTGVSEFTKQNKTGKEDYVALQQFAVIQPWWPSGLRHRYPKFK